MLRVTKKDGEKPVIKVENKYPNLKHLKRAGSITPLCNDCPMKPVNEGGNGKCTEYIEDSACIIRKDIKKAVENYKTRDPVEILELVIVDFENNFEDIQFLSAIERMSGETNQELTKRKKLHIDLARLVNELKSRKSKIEIEQKTISDDVKTEISRIIRMEQEDGN